MVGLPGARREELEACALLPVRLKFQSVFRPGEGTEVGTFGACALAFSLRLNTLFFLILDLLQISAFSLRLNTFFFFASHFSQTSAFFPETEHFFLSDILFFTDLCSFFLGLNIFFSLLTITFDSGVVNGGAKVCVWEQLQNCVWMRMNVWMCKWMINYVCVLESAGGVLWCVWEPLRNCAWVYVSVWNGNGKWVPETPRVHKHLAWDVRSVCPQRAWLRTDQPMDTCTSPHSSVNWGPIRKVTYYWYDSDCYLEDVCWTTLSPFYLDAVCYVLILIVCAGFIYLCSIFDAMCWVIYFI